MVSYNGLFEKAVNSILFQKTNYKFEIIIIIDNPDKVIYEKIKDQYFSYIESRKIILIQNDINLGLTKSLNKAINYSQGRFILRNDQDDISNRSRINDCMNIVQNNKKIKLVFSDYRSIKGNKIYKRKTLYWGNKLKNIIKYKNPIAHSSVLFEKKNFINQGGYDQSFKTSQDFKLWSKIVMNNDNNFYHVKKYLVDIHYPLESISRRSSKTQRINSILICLENSHKIILDKFDNNDLKNSIRNIYKNNSISVSVNNKITSLIFCYLYDENLLSLKKIMKLKVLKLIILTYFFHPGLLFSKLKYLVGNKN